MTLRDLMGNDAPDVEVSGLAYSSRSVTPGTLFFCVPGFRADGHDFAPDAVARGAVALVCQRPLGLGVPEVIVDDVRAAMGPAAARFYGDPTHVLEVVGVTGTNGKTTTAFLLRHLLEAGGRQTGLLGTVKRVVGGVEEEVERTTPEAIDLQATFRAMLDKGDRACAMEVSSHALELGRVAGIRFACRIFTNLTQDHLDFHETMEAYFAAKRRLFEQPGLSVVNVDDEYGQRIAAEVEAVSFGVDYAHTPEALENVLRAAKEVTQGRLHVVFGAGGDRDRGKRPLMGAAARRLADRVLVTSDNPRSEEPEAIVDAIMEGAGPDAERETDRRRAIALAIETAEPGDVVVIAGKGHEQGQEFENGRKEPFDDVAEARTALRARLGARA